MSNVIQAEIIKLKKEVHHLREQNADLQGELEEKNQKMGQFESEYLKMKNETLLITRTKLMQQGEIIKQNVERVLEDERDRIESLERNYEEALKKIAYYEQERINLESHQKELQIETNQLKKQLLDYGKKTQTTDFINEIKSRDDVLLKQGQEYQRIVKEWNELCDRMEDLISENRLLRELAKVPENYGINIEDIKLGDRMKIEDYKAKIRILQRDVDDLETERAQLKHKLYFLANALEINEPPFSMLTTEQKKVVAEYAQALYEKREFIQPERYELIRENQNLRNKIEIYEKQLSNTNIDNSYRIYHNPSQNDKKDNPRNLKQNDNFQDIVDMLRKENEDLKALLGKSLDKFSIISDEIFSKNQKINIIPNNLNNLSPYDNANISNSNINKSAEYSYLQLPPMPIVDNKDVDNTGYGNSYRFQSRIKIDPNNIHQLFGIAKNEEDVVDLKIESASLQLQLIETLEILSRMQTQDENQHENLEKLQNKLENITHMQNELFERYVKEKKSYTEIFEQNSKNNRSLLEETTEIRRRLKVYEETIVLIENKNPSQIEQKAIDKMKENAILEFNLIKLQRKYDALFEEEDKLRKYVDDFEKSTMEKDTQLESTIIKLKEWKYILSFYAKFLMKKLKKSVDRDEFDRVIDENRYLREKYNEIIMRDINITKQISLVENYKIRIKETEENFFMSEEKQIDCEIELNYIKKKLEETDPEFHNQEKIFRKFLQRLNKNRITFQEIRKTFDKDNSGKITRNEFIQALDVLNIAIENESELNLLIKSLNYDEEEKIDTMYFIRKLERTGIFDETEDMSSDELILRNFVDGVNKSGMALKSVFELFDSSGDGKISKEEFKFALQQLKMNIQDDALERIVFIINNSDHENTHKDNDNINYIQFCELFDRQNRHLNIKNIKKNNVKNSLKIDWKTNMFSTIVDAIRKNELSFADAFKYLDKDNSGNISKEEFSLFLRKITINFTDTEVTALFKVLDKTSKGTIALDDFILVLKECEAKIQIFNEMTGADDGELGRKNTLKGANIPTSSFLNNNSNSHSNSNSTESIKLKNQLHLLKEKEKYYSYKIQQMRNRLEESEKNSREVSAQLEDYVKKHSDMMTKYFSAGEELQKLKNTYEANGVKREDLSKVELDNDRLAREVTVLRVGMNTFKDLYSSTGRQNQMLLIKSQRNQDELDTYKKAIKELQSDSNSSALLGKLYYSLLISRWRESNTLRKYEDFINDFAAVREQNYSLEAENKLMIKDISELQTVLHEKIIQNLRLEDTVQHYANGIPNQTIEQLDSLKELIKELSSEKTSLSQKYFTIRKENLRLQNECDELRSKVDYSDSLVSRIKYSSYDEYSTKLIETSEENANIKLNHSILTRENVFLKERETYLEKLIEHFNNNVKNLEESKADLDGKYRRVEEQWKRRDEERQKKFFEHVRSLNIDELKNINNKGGNASTTQLNEHKNKISELSEVLAGKNAEINRLMSINKENEEALQNRMGIFDNNERNNLNPPYELLSKTNLEIMKDDETQLVAQTAHKTIKTLQDLLNSKSEQIKKKEETIERLKKNTIDTKNEYLEIINKLQMQIQMDHNSTLSKLKHVLEQVNHNLLVKISKTQLSTMTLTDIEALLEEKDMSIKTLALQYKNSREENEINYLKISDLSKRVNDLTLELSNRRFTSGIDSQNEEVERLRLVIREKSEMIDEEKSRIRRLEGEFAKRIQDKILLEDQLFRSSVHVPERLQENQQIVENYQKLHGLRNKNKKLRAEIDKLAKLLEESKTKSDETLKTIEKLKNEKEFFMQTQIKDTKAISRLKKENEDLKAEKLKLRERIENLEKMQTSLNLDLNLSSNVKKRPGSVTRKKPIEAEKKISVSSITEIKEIKPLKIEEVKLPQEESAHDILRRLVYYCIKKNINMNRHLSRWDLTKLGKLTKADFTKAINELKLGFIASDLQKLIENLNLVDDYIEISEFVKIMVEKENNYEMVLKETDYVFDPNSFFRKQPTNKYTPLENKNFNINY